MSKARLNPDKLRLNPEFRSQLKARPFTDSRDSEWTLSGDATDPRLAARPRGGRRMALALLFFGVLTAGAWQANRTLWNPGVGMEKALEGARSDLVVAKEFADYLATKAAAEKATPAAKSSAVVAPAAARAVAAADQEPVDPDQAEEAENQKEQEVALARLNAQLDLEVAQQSDPSGRSAVLFRALDQEQNPYLKRHILQRLREEVARNPAAAAASDEPRIDERPPADED